MWKRVGIYTGIIISAFIAFVSFLACLLTIVFWVWGPLPGQPPEPVGVKAAMAAFAAGAAVVGLCSAYLTWRLKSTFRGRQEPEHALFCECCGREAPTIRASLNRHIGAIILMFHVSNESYLCKRCIASTFWRFTLVTLLLGWWGFLSMIITPIVLLNNVITYVRSLFMAHEFPSRR
jgi:hypothetical protein